MPLIPMTRASNRFRALWWLVGVLALVPSRVWPQSDFTVRAPSNQNSFPDTGSLIPFQSSVPGTGLSSIRYQQVYHASLFTNLPPGFPYLSEIIFRRDEDQIGNHSWTITNMQIRLSTTSRDPDDLFTTFADNVGPDEIVALGPKRFLMNNQGSQVNFRVPLDRPFVYNPAAGNLLLEVRLDGIQDATGSSMDASRSTADGISRIWATNAAALVANATDMDGLVTLFNFYGVPALTITAPLIPTPEHTLAVVWSTQPSFFRLQKSTNCGVAAKWEFVTNAAPPYYFIPADAIDGKSAFFRLVWPDGP